MELHVGSLFANDIPTTPSAIVKQISFRLGIEHDPTSFVRKGSMEISEMTKMLQPFFDEKEGRGGRTLYLLEKNIKEKALTKRPTSGSLVLSRQQGNVRDQGKVQTLVQFTRALEIQMVELMAPMQINYLNSRLYAQAC
jgi:hypothetical protein